MVWSSCSLTVPNWKAGICPNCAIRAAKFVIKDMIALAQDKGEGFYSYTWTKPGEEGKDFEKIAYIKYFKPFKWFYRDWGIY